MLAMATTLETCLEGPFTRTIIASDLLHLKQQKERNSFSDHYERLRRMNYCTNVSTAQLSCGIHPFSELPSLSSPNRAMQLRCAMRFESRFESHNPKSLAMRTPHRLALESQEICNKAPAKILRCWPAMRNIGVHVNIERCEMLAIRTLAAVWPAMQVPAMPNR